jgi:hypothetical protein
VFYKQPQRQVKPEVFAKNSLGKKESGRFVFGISLTRGVKNGMNNWYSVSLGDGIMAAAPSAEIEAAFLQSFTAAEKPPEMAVFTHPELEGRLHCEVFAYFSPATVAVAKVFDAEPCEKSAQECPR